MNTILRWTAPAAPVVRCRPSHLSALGWLALQALALWPHGAWMLRRAADGSDAPLGATALALLALLLWRHAPQLRLVPRLDALAAAAALTLAANALALVLPPLAAALVAALALAAGLLAWWPATVPRLAPVGLLLLALPWIASLQYYAGYPLRALTAQASAWALQLAGLDVERQGAALTVAGRLVLVDAPCSGVQMAWLAYCAALAVAAFTALPDRRLLARLPVVGALVLAGNIVRNTLLVALETRPQGLAGWAHEALGLVVLAAVLAAVVAWMRPAPATTEAR